MNRDFVSNNRKRAFSLAAIVTAATIAIYATAIGPVVIQDNDVANPFPSVGAVPGTCTGNITTIRLKLNGFAHSCFNDVGVALRSPAGSTLQVFGGSAYCDQILETRDYTFDSSSTNDYTNSSALDANGTYRPIVDVDLGGNRVFTTIGDVPDASTSTTLANTFIGQSPIGNWNLYVEDFSAQDDGNLTSWDVEIGTSTGKTCRIGEALAPTAAPVNVSGRILTAEGRGIRNVRVYLTDQFGVTRSAISSSFGYYKFDEVEPSGSIILEAAAKNYVFENQTRILSLSDNMEEQNFIAFATASRGLR